MTTPPSRRLILLAEDEVTVRNLIRSFLQNAGFDVLAAADGDEALELSRAHAETIDLFLTDVEMPHVDGLSAYRQISTERPKIKVLFISSGGILSQLRLPEPWPFLSKPFEADTLRTKLNEILPLAERVAVAQPHTPAWLTILVVEDEAAVRNLIVHVLVRQDYWVLEADSAAEALEVSNTLEGTIDLLIADHTLKTMMGRHVAEQIRHSRPSLKVLQISGHPIEKLQQEGGLIPDGEFLPEPFLPKTLTEKVNRILGSTGCSLGPPGPGAAAGHHRG